MALGMTMYQAYHGEGNFNPAITDLRAIAPLYPNVTHIIVRADVPAQTVADFAGLTVSVGAAGSGTEAQSSEVPSRRSMRPERASGSATLAPSSCCS